MRVSHCCALTRMCSWENSLWLSKHIPYCEKGKWWLQWLNTFHPNHGHSDSGTCHKTQFC
ncbi:hypothetical protein CsatB_019082 [Cannabis sativa]